MGSPQHTRGGRKLVGGEPVDAQNRPGGKRHKIRGVKPHWMAKMNVAPEPEKRPSHHR